MGDHLKQFYLSVEEKQKSIDTPNEGLAVLLCDKNDDMVFYRLCVRRGEHHKFDIDPKKLLKGAKGNYGVIHTHPIISVGMCGDGDGQIEEIFPHSSCLSETDKENVVNGSIMVIVVLYRGDENIRMQCYGHFNFNEPLKYSISSLGKALLPIWLEKFKNKKANEL